MVRSTLRTLALLAYSNDARSKIVAYKQLLCWCLRLIGLPLRCPTIEGHLFRPVYYKIQRKIKILSMINFNVCLQITHYIKNL